MKVKTLLSVTIAALGLFAVSFAIKPGRLSFFLSVIALTALFVTPSLALGTWWHNRFPNAEPRFARFCSMLCILGGLGIFGWQVLTWLQTGAWRGLPLSLAFDNRRDSFAQWLATPHSWYGLHAITVAVLDNVSWPTLLILLGIVQIESPQRQPRERPPK